MGLLIASLVNLNGSGRYIHWGFVQMSVANLILIGLMVLAFIAAILVPYRRHGRGDR
jgi:ABC-type proline/glycine betaine transport system permease subunit